MDYQRAEERAVGYRPSARKRDAAECIFPNRLAFRFSLPPCVNACLYLAFNPRGGDCFFSTGQIQESGKKFSLGKSRGFRQSLALFSAAKLARKFQMAFWKGREKSRIGPGGESRTTTKPRIVSTLGARFVKPSVYLRPMAHPTSKARVAMRRDQAVRCALE
jgi:hypothetical protein